MSFLIEERNGDGKHIKDIPATYNTLIDIADKDVTSESGPSNVAMRLLTGGTITIDTPDGKHFLSLKNL